MFDIKDNIVAILGGKRSGEAIARLVVRQGGIAKISEQANRDSFSSEFLAWASANDVQIETGGHTQAFIDKSDLVILSPGVPFYAKPVKWAQELHIPVLGEIEFGSQFCEAPIIAVTGSNGKTTVSTLIHRVLQSNGLSVELCGNVGDPFCNYADQSSDKDYIVLEISSFQMESLVVQPSPFRGFKPHVAILLNFSENHLDRHADLDEYFTAKTKIFQNQDSNDVAIINTSIDRVKQLLPRLKARVVELSGQEDNPNHTAVVRVSEILRLDQTKCQQVLQEFPGVEHRLEKVCSINGVDYINDSKSTTAEAGRWAIEHIEKPIIMICGGRDKNIPFSQLSEIVRDKVKQMYVIGEASEKIRQSFDKVIPVESCQDLENAVRRAKAAAQGGDCVVLSPMCASFDMFADYEERGRIFKSIVSQLESE